LPNGQTEQGHPSGASKPLGALLSPPTTPHVGYTGGDEERTPDEGNDSAVSATIVVRALRKMDAGQPEPSSSLMRRLQTSALMPMPGSAAYVDPFATSTVHIDGEMATLLRLYTHVILPRVRFHKTISEACSNLTASHALKHPMLLYAVLCRASIEPRPEDGDPQDGGRMHQASVSRAGRQESIKFKLQTIQTLNEQISNTRLADDHFPILHTISFLLRIEVSLATHNAHRERSGVRT
jgi:hypothetical protein